jgi:antirestriction protein ArdC/phage/plasmid primase-like uncharacterized protein
MEKKKPFFEAFAEKIIAELEAGTAPWIKPWKAGEYTPPFNPVSGTKYRGINRVTLDCDDNDPRFMTMRQANSKGWRIRKGAKARPVVFWQFYEERAVKDEDGKPVRDQEGNQVMTRAELDRPRVIFSSVFHASDVDGIPPWEGRTVSWDSNVRAEDIMRNSGAVIHHDQRDRAFYRPSTDEIHLPPRSAFADAGAYYGTALHELGHWTKHPDRLDREGGPFGSEAYAREELRAEIASWMISGELGLPHDPSQHLSYVDSWVKILTEEPREILRASQDAEKILGFCLGFEKNKEAAMTAEVTQSKPEQSEEQERRPAQEKTYLAVPYEQREEAKQAGAKWDRQEKLWFAPEGTDMTGLARWVPEKEPAPAPGMPPEQEFAEVLKEAGLDLGGEQPVMDGTLHRVQLIDGKPGSRDGAYRGNLDGHPAGFYQNHKTGEKGTWKASGHKLTEEQKQALAIQATEKKQKWEQELAAQHAAAAKKAFARWANAPGWADKSQAYLARKEVLGFGVKEGEHGELLVPGRDVDGFIHTVQSISDAGKFFTKGSRKSGTFHRIDPEKQFEKDGMPILVAEGYATAASVHMATNLPVHAAFDAGNLEPVAKALKEKYPDRQVVILADDDHQQKDNPGMNKAALAAQAVDGLMILPKLTDEEKQKGLTDFNDMHVSRGLDAVRKQIQTSLEVLAGKTQVQEAQVMGM